MLRELKKDDWLSLLGIPAERIPHALILRGTRALKTQYKNHRRLFTNVVDVESPSILFEDVLIGEYRGRNIGYASVYGPAMAAEIAHLFGALGTRLVVQTGCCGGLVDHVLPGDLFIATEAYCGEGAARYYGQDAIASASRDVLDLLQIRSLADVPCHIGRIYTTAALFAEGEEELRTWRGLQCDAVDMETATTFAVARHFGMHCLSVLFVFDNPLGQAHILSNDMAVLAQRRRGNECMIRLALQIAVNHERLAASGRDVSRDDAAPAT